MTQLSRRLNPLVLLIAALATAGCAETEPGTSINPTPATVLSPTAPDETKKPSEPTVAAHAEPAKTSAPDKAEAKPATPTISLSTAKAPDNADGVSLDQVKYPEYLKRVTNKDAKFTLVDAWATWCAPCKENFPHVLEMDKKYAAKGLKVISLSLDDPSESKDVAEARKFLQEKKATITNLLMDEDRNTAFEKLNISAIPAVFLYGPDGKEMARFTMDDPNDQFTYAEVEQTVKALLDGKPLPAKAKKADVKKAAGE